MSSTAIFRSYLRKIQMNEKNIILNNQNLTVSKKNLKKALLAEGLDVSLSKSANLLAQTFGFKHEHELQQNLKDNQSSPSPLICFYFDEMLALFGLGISLIDKYRKTGLDIFTVGLSFFSDDTINRLYHLESIFKNNRELIIHEGLNIRTLMIVRRLFNELSLKKIGKNHSDFYFFYLFYNYHNVEPYFLMSKSERNKYYFQPPDFEKDLSICSDSLTPSLSFALPEQINREVEYYNKEDGILIKRDIYSTASKKIMVGNSFHEFSYAKINKK